MAKIRKKQVKALISLGVVVFLWVIVPPFFKRFSNNFFYEFQAPAWISGAAIRDIQTYWTGKITSRSELIQQGKDLARVNANYQYQLQQLSTLESQVDRYEELFDIPSLPSYRSEVARVARRDMNGWWQEITVNKGKNYDISVGAPVIFSGGVVGKVKEVHLHTSVITMITSINIRLAAMVEGDTRPVLYQGMLSGPFSPPQGQVMNIPTDIEVKKDIPRRLITSGLGGVFPAGLTIGWIRNLDASSDGLFQSGNVELDHGLNELREIAILIEVN